MPGLFSKETRAKIAMRPGEGRIVVLAATWFFFVLAGYSILRPIREDMGVAGGVRNLPWLFLGTLTVMLIVNPIYGAVVSRVPRRRFIALVYRFFISNLLVFLVLMLVLPAGAMVQVGRVFFIWMSVFNLFVVTVFWSFLAENFGSQSAKRLYAWIAVGGTLGAIAGSGITYVTTSYVAGTYLPGLMLLSAVFLEIAVRCQQRLADTLETQGVVVRSGAPDAGLGGSALEGLAQVARSPYLRRMCLYLLCYTVTGSLLYFMQADIVKAQFGDDRGARTNAFALITLATQVLTLLLQLFVTSRMIAWLGVGLTLTLLPLSAGLSFVGLAVEPVFWMLVVMQSLRGSTRYAISKPARETLFSVLTPSEKYKAKALIDTFVYRSGDVLGAGAKAMADAAGLGLVALAACSLPLCAGWVTLGVVLGREQARRAAAQEDESAAGE